MCEATAKPGPSSSLKSEIRSTKSETIPKSKMIKTSELRGFGFLNLVIWICFEIRASNFAMKSGIAGLPEIL
jgi:hypothetical protein